MNKGKSENDKNVCGANFTQISRKATRELFKNKIEKHGQFKHTSTGKESIYGK